MYTPAKPHARRLLPRPWFLLVAAVAVAACGTQPGPTAAPTASPSPSVSPSASASASAAAAPCAAGDLAITASAWGGAAGSRGSDIAVRNQGSAACILPAAPTVAIVDDAGTVQLNTAPLTGEGPTLEPDASATFSIVVGNWCDQQATLPLHVSLALASASVDIPGLELATVDELPPCNGPGQPATLEATAWQPG